MDIYFITKILLIIVLFVLSGLVSGSEVSFFSLNSKQLDKKTGRGSIKIRLIEKMLSRPKRLLATILVANNFLNIAIVLLIASISDQLFAGIANSNIRFLLEIILITFVILLFTDILPKVYANSKNLKFSKLTARSLYRADKFGLFLLTIPMSYTLNLIERKFTKNSANFSLSELSNTLEYTGQNNTSKQDKRMLKGILNLGNTYAKQVMCPRVNIFSLSINMQLEEILPLIIKNGFSRIPVTNNNNDKVEGILYVKDLIQNINDESFKWQTILKQPYYVSEKNKLDDLLLDFKDKKIHMGIVVDEYGITIGLITLEDLIEEIVGEISDEYDDDEIEYELIDDRNYLVNGDLTLNDFYRIFKIVNPASFENARGDSETLAGFLIEMNANIPTVGTKLSHEKFQFTIKEATFKKIDKILVTLEH